MSTETESKSQTVGLPEAAEVLGVHRATVNDMVRAGRLEARREGAHWAIERSELERFAATYTRPSNAPMRRPQPTLPTTTDQITQLLEEFGSASPLELAELVGVHEGNMRKHLRLLEHRGIVVRRPDGQWALPQED